MNVLPIIIGLLVCQNRLYRIVAFQSRRYYVTTNRYADKLDGVVWASVTSRSRDHGNEIDNQKEHSQHQQQPPSQHCMTVESSSPVNSSSRLPLQGVKDESRNQLELPWSDVQMWALADHVPRYTVHLPPANTDPKPRAITLWRSLSNEVTELSGYPIQFLVDRQMELQEACSTPSGSSPPNGWTTRTRTSSTILPYLDDYDFTPEGGLTGIVYGILGVAEGTRIETTPVRDLLLTLPKGYIQTKDGSVVYELGRPRLSTQMDSLSRENAMLVARSFWGERKNLKIDRSLSIPPAIEGVSSLSSLLDPDVVNIGVLTVFALVGATAIESLSHHLTVNVFWV